MLAKAAAEILDAKKAENINVIRITNISSLGDYFVIANGTSNTHVHALADELEEKLKAEGRRPPVWKGTARIPGSFWIMRKSWCTCLRRTRANSTISTDYGRTARNSRSNLNPTEKSAQRCV